MSYEHDPSSTISGIIGQVLSDDERAVIEANAAAHFGVESVNVDPNFWAVGPTLEGDAFLRASLALAAISKIARQIIASRGIDDILVFTVFGGEEERPDAAALVSTEFGEHDFQPIHESFANEVNDVLFSLESPYRL